MAVQAIPKPCPICRKVNTNKTGYCDEHEPAYLKQKAFYVYKYNVRRGSPSKRGYDATWVKVRKTYLMQHPMCEQCEKEGRITPAREVHHIKAINDGGARLDPDNLMAVCRPCHQKFTEEQMRARRGEVILNNQTM